MLEVEGSISTVPVQTSLRLHQVQCMAGVREGAREGHACATAVWQFHDAKRASYCCQPSLVRNFGIAQHMG